jgi:transcriptional regulator with XRE-family HTH domain
MFSVVPGVATLPVAAEAQLLGTAKVARPGLSATKKRLQALQRSWLHEIVASSGLKLAQIATKAGVSDTTLSRLANDEAYEGTLSQLTIARIKEAFRVPGPEEYGAGGGRRRFGLAGFAEAQRFVPKAEPEPLAAAVSALIGDRHAIDAWRLRTEALVEAGYLAGDIVLVDMNASPEPQDAVCAQVYDWQRGGAETVWRIYDPPFLVAAAHERTAYKPLLVDNDRVIIKGVLIGSIRPHALSTLR